MGAYGIRDQDATSRLVNAVSFGFDCCNTSKDEASLERKTIVPIAQAPERKKKRKKFGIGRPRDTPSSQISCRARAARR